MEYKSYKILQQLHEKLVKKSLRAYAKIRLFNNRLYEGFLIDVSNNRISILLEDGFVVSFVYTKIKEIEISGNEIIKRIYEQIINNELDNSK